MHHASLLGTITLFLFATAIVQFSAQRGAFAQAIAAPDSDEEDLLDEFTDDEEDILEVITVETTARADRGAMSGSAQRVEQLDPELLERRGATNLAEALEWLSAGSSVSPTNTSQGLMLDGLPTSQLVLLRDGLPLARPAGSQQGPIIDLASIAINPQTIERIDIYRGSGPVGSGSAGGVIIDIITRRPEPGVMAMLRAQTSSKPSLDPLFANDLMGSVTWSRTPEIGLSGNAIYSGVRALDVDGDGVPDTPAQQRGGGEFAWSWRPSSNDFLRFMVLGNTSQTESLGGEGAIFDDVVDRQLLRFRTQGRWWLTQDVRLDHNLDLGKENNRFRKRVRASEFLRLKADTEQESAQQVVTVTWFTRRHDLAAEAYGRGWRIERTGETGNLPEVEQGELGAGLADTFYPTDRTELFARVVGERSSAYGAGLNAQASVSYTLLPARWVVRSTASSTRRVPTPEELYLSFDHSEVGYKITGNPDLLPERLHSLQLSSVWNTADKRFGLELQSFVHQIEDMVTFATGSQPGVFTYENVSRARVIGVQLQSQLAKLFWDVQLLSNYTYLPFARDLDLGERLPQRPEHAGRLELRRGFLKSRKLELWTDVSARSSFLAPSYLGGLPTQSSGELVQGSVVWGAGARYKFNESWQVMLDANNLLDQYDVRWGPLPGRFIYLNLTWQKEERLEETL